jgi:hypothetical protein
MSGARHHHKGIRIEREILSCHQALGIHAARHPLSGASRFRGGGHDVDIYLFGPDEAPSEEGQGIRYTRKMACRIRRALPSAKLRRSTGAATMAHMGAHP